MLSFLDRYKIPADCRLEMTPADLKMARELLKEDFIQKNPLWVKVCAVLLIDRLAKLASPGTRTDGIAERKGRNSCVAAPQPFSLLSFPAFSVPFPCLCLPSVQNACLCFTSVPRCGMFHVLIVVQRRCRRTVFSTSLKSICQRRSEPRIGFERENIALEAGSDAPRWLLKRSPQRCCQARKL